MVDDLATPLASEALMRHDASEALVLAALLEIATSLELKPFVVELLRTWQLLASAVYPSDAFVLLRWLRRYPSLLRDAELGPWLTSLLERYQAEATAAVAALAQETETETTVAAAAAVVAAAVSLAHSNGEGDEEDEEAAAEESVVQRMARTRDVLQLYLDQLRSAHDGIVRCLSHSNSSDSNSSGSGSDSGSLCPPLPPTIRGDVTRYRRVAENGLWATVVDDVLLHDDAHRNVIDRDGRDGGGDEEDSSFWWFGVHPSHLRHTAGQVLSLLSKHDRSHSASHRPLSTSIATAGGAGGGGASVTEAVFQLLQRPLHAAESHCYDQWQASHGERDLDLRQPLVQEEILR